MKDIENRPPLEAAAQVSKAVLQPAHDEPSTCRSTLFRIPTWNWRCEIATGVRKRTLRSRLAILTFSRPTR